MKQDVQQEIDDTAKTQEQLINCIEQLTSQVQSLERQLERLSITSYSESPTATRKKAQLPYTTKTVRDRKHRIIRVGDKVRFLSTGKFNSTEGIVKSIGKAFVFSIDSQKRRISRAPHNLLVIQSSYPPIITEDD